MALEDYPLDKDGWPKLTRPQLLAECIRVVSDSYDNDIEPTIRGVYYDLISEHLIKPDAKEGEGKPADRRRNARRVIDVVARAKEAGEFPLHWLRDSLRVPEEGETTTCSLDVDDGLEQAADWLRALPDWSIEVDRWYAQPTVVLVVIEKDTLTGRCKRPVKDHEVPFFVCRGYPSWTGVYAWFKQLVELHDKFSQWDEYPDVVVLYMGDHDPDGMFIPEAMQNIVGVMEEQTGEEIPDVRWERVALTQEQAYAAGAPSMGVKMSSTRAPRYVAQYGMDAWEAEAMSGVEARDLLDQTITDYFDQHIYDTYQAEAAERREELLEKMREPGWAEGVLS